MSASDWIAEMFGEAAADARAKLIDEAWFGRRGAEPHDGLGWTREPAAEEVSFGWGFEQQSAEVQALWGVDVTPAPEPADRSAEPALIPADLDRGIDR